MSFTTTLIWNSIVTPGGNCWKIAIDVLVKTRINRLATMSNKTCTIILKIIITNIVFVTLVHDLK